MKSVILPRDLIDPDPNQPRLHLDREELKQLALSWRELGQLQPIIVYVTGERYRIVDGHRRYAAAGLVNHHEINCVVLERRPDEDMLLLTQLAANCMRVDLKPTEKALAYQRLKESRGWSNTELARAMHVSKAAVTQTLSFLNLPEEARVKLDAGELAASTAYAIARAPDEGTGQQLLAKALNGRLKRDEAMRHVQQNGSPKSRKFRITFRLDTADVSVVSADRLDLQGHVAVWQRLIRECRRASKEGIDVATLERVLADKHGKATTGC